MHTRDNVRQTRELTYVIGHANTCSHQVCNLKARVEGTYCIHPALSELMTSLLHLLSPPHLTMVWCQPQLLHRNLFFLSNLASVMINPAAKISYFLIWLLGSNERCWWNSFLKCWPRDYENPFILGFFLLCQPLLHWLFCCNCCLFPLPLPKMLVSLRLLF